MNTNIKSISESIFRIADNSNLCLKDKFRLLHSETVLLCKDILNEENVYTNDLHDLTETLFKDCLISEQARVFLHCLATDTEKVMDMISAPDEEMFEYSVKSVTAIASGTVPDGYIEKYISLWRRKHIRQENGKPIKRIRCTFTGHYNNYIVVIPNDDPLRHEIKVQLQKYSGDYTFRESILCLKKGMKVNLVDCSWEDDILNAEIIVIEPDYMMDISTVADCVKEYGTHPANYYYQLLKPAGNKKALILGNIVNQFLDEWIYSPTEPKYMDTMKKVFRRHSLELITCPEIDADERDFFNTCNFHFENLRKTVKGIFPDKRYGLNTEDAVLEPSYICETLGLQGRLDYMQRDVSSLIEMKSGKADEFTRRGKIEALLPNKVQMMLYLATLQYTLDIDHRNIRAYLLYTRYPELYTSTPSWEMVRKAINARNRIVADEYLLHTNNSPEFTERIISQISPAIINENMVEGRLWSDFIAPEITRFRNSIVHLDKLEKAYYMSLFTFISNELYLSKTGNGEQDRNNSSSIWDMTVSEKEEKGLLIKNMRIMKNRISDIHSPFIIFSMPMPDNDYILNFRNGDPVIVYERNSDYDKATNKMIFKGNIEDMTGTEIKIRFRSPQRNPKVIDGNSMFAVEPDYNDKPTLSMFGSLDNFVNGNADRTSLILGTREPDFDEKILKESDCEEDDFGRIATKSLAAKDMMLIIGPPGSGKTSWALKRIVERHLENPDSNILLLSYTNRAVDEICKSISAITPETDFIRLGNELACDEKFRDHLIENRLKGCSRRSEAREIIGRCRIFVSTVVTLQSKTEIFKLKKFDCAVIDESTQILEPQILGILTAKTPDGQNAIGKFIMIGDNKQLPAVTLQSEKDAEIKSGILKDAGFRSFKESLFERLYRIYNEKGHTCIDMLCKQGRMHKDIADFSSRYFYFDRLVPVGLEHQKETNSTAVITSANDYQNIVRMRMAFIPSSNLPYNHNDKTNREEAETAASLAYSIYIENRDNFDAEKTVGIIAPYRNQIALIRRALNKTGIDELNRITVDTVERYQGSERDYIIFTFCLNKPYQIRMMANTIYENGASIDRKLNVALTRARKHLFIIGNEEIMNSNHIYRKLIEYMKEKGFYINKG